MRIFDRGAATDLRQRKAFQRNPLTWPLRFQVGFADFAVAFAAVNIELYPLRAGYVVEAVKLKHSQSFGGGGLATYTLSVGIATNFTKYLPAFDVFQAPGDLVYGLAASMGGEGHASTTSLRIRAVCSGGLLSAANAGLAEVWLKVSRAT